MKAKQLNDCHSQHKIRDVYWDFSAARVVFIV